MRMPNKRVAPTVLTTQSVVAGYTLFMGVGRQSGHEHEKRSLKWYKADDFNGQNKNILCAETPS